MKITNNEHIDHAVAAGAAIAETCSDVGYVVTAMRRMVGVKLSETTSFHVERPFHIGKLGNVRAVTDDGHQFSRTFLVAR